MKFKIFSDIANLTRFAAESFVEIGSRAIEEKGWFAVALSGGSTPKALYQLLASESFKNKIDWTKVFFFFGDERRVPPDDEESNFRMANENFFQLLRIPDENIFRWQTELGNAGKIAADYEQRIENFFELDVKPPAHAGGSDKKSPRFDLILLGMGTDGHTASLFPFTEAVKTGCVSGRSTVAVNYVEKLGETRFTMTFPVINNAANIIFLITGAEKAETLKEVLEGEYNPEKFPAQKVKPTNGNLLWLVDAEAARLLQ